MNRQKIFEIVRDIIVEKLKLKIEQKELTLDFPLFESEIYDKRKLWDSSGSSPHVIHWRSEDAQYYSYRLITKIGQDSLDALEIQMALEEEFDIEIPDEIAFELGTFELAVDYIIQKVAEAENK